jgi:arylsulfatase A-like enzyme
MTGRYPGRYGITRPINNPTGGLPPQEVTIAELLKAQGSATGLIGKWHLGLTQDKSPIAQGFDYYSGVPLSQIQRDPKAHAEYYKRQWRIQDATGRNDVEHDPCEEQFTQRCTKEALAFIDRNKARPFFLYLAQLMVHVEVVASPEFVGKSPRGVYGDACQELDWSVGEVLDHLKKLGLDERTLVVYTSDNGGTTARNHVVPQTSLASNLPLRGHKFQIWEGGNRVPCILRWPGQIPADRVSDEIVGVVDFLPTFAHLAGATVPQDRAVDGLNVWPFLHGDLPRSPRQTHSYYNASGAEAVRVGPWKLVGQNALFNLQTDLSETTDVAAQHPDIVEQLRSFRVGVVAALKADKPLPLTPSVLAPREYPAPAPDKLLAPGKGKQ